MILDRILIHASQHRRIPIEPDDIYYLEADDHDTLIRLRSRRRVRDVRGLGDLETILEPYHHMRVHRNFIVNLRRIHEFRQRRDGDGWELKLQPPVNLIIPIGRTFESQLWQAFADRV